MTLDGGMRLYGELSPESAAVVCNALDTKMRPPTTGKDQPGDTGDGAGVDPDDGVGVGRWAGTAAGRAAATALVAVAKDALGGTPDRPARPLLVASVDLSQVNARPWGTVELNLRGHLARISAGALERLARDADLQLVVKDGARPLAVSDKVSLAAVAAKTRLAVKTRDRGCRWPGSQDPIGHTDLDHIKERARGGNHDPDNLVALSRRFHTIRHRHGWKLSLEPESGMLTIERAGRAYHSLPRGTGLAPLPDRPPDEPPGEPGAGGGSDPPGSPPPDDPPGDPPDGPPDNRTLPF